MIYEKSTPTLLVDGQIHRAAGGELLRECEWNWCVFRVWILVPTHLPTYLACLDSLGRKLGGAETGAAKITKGYKLPAYVVFSLTSSLPPPPYQISVLVTETGVSFSQCARYPCCGSDLRPR